MPVYQLNPNQISFPYPEYAREDGLLAIGGDLSIQRLILAYSNGIFPWYNPGEEILWWCPRERFIIKPSEIHVSKSMKKFFKKHDIYIQINRDFTDTIHRCRINHEFTDGTWITDDMEQAFIRLHKAGYAISVEAFVDEELAGGLYGVVLGKCFFGESMFTYTNNGSKIALIMLAQALNGLGCVMIDCQMHTEHLESMGGKYISWQEYDDILEKYVRAMRY